MLSTSSKELGTRHQTPTLIGCEFLKSIANFRAFALRFASLTSFCRHQHRSEILICFLLRRQVFLKISFRNTQQLGCSGIHFLYRLKLSHCVSRYQQRGEILICFRSVVKYFLKISFRQRLQDLQAPNEPSSSPQTFRLGRQPQLTALPSPVCAALCDQRSPRL